MDTILKNNTINKTKKVWFSNKMVQLNKVSYNGINYYLNKKLFCESGFNNNENYYYIKCDELDIFVYNKTPETTIEAFKFMFDGLAKDFAFELNDKLTDSGIKFKFKLRQLLKKITIDEATKD